MGEREKGGPTTEGEKRTNPLNKKTKIKKHGKGKWKTIKHGCGDFPDGAVLTTNRRKEKGEWPEGPGDKKVTNDRRPRLDQKRTGNGKGQKGGESATRPPPGGGDQSNDWVRIEGKRRTPIIVPCQEGNRPRSTAIAREWEGGDKREKMGSGRKDNILARIREPQKPEKGRKATVTPYRRKDFKGVDRAIISGLP